MIWRYRRSLSLVSLTAFLVGLAFHADAGVMVFHNRDDWRAALGRASFDAFNFSAFTSPTSFATDAINFGNFSLSTLGTAEPGTNFVNVPPFDDVNDNSIDRSAYASMFLDSTRGVALQTFAPQFAFGGDFSGSGAINFSVFSLNQEITRLGGPTPGVQFFGFISTEAFNRIEFQYSGPTDGFSIVGLDNVGLAQTSAVPEPTSLLMLGMGVSLLGGYGCWKKGRQNDQDSPRGDA